MPESERPLLNPVLSLRINPKLASARGGGKSSSSIVDRRLDGQRDVLSRQLMDLYSRRDDLKQFAGGTLIVAQMFDDSFAKSWTPDDLFAPVSGAQLVLPVKRGYLVEVKISALQELSCIARTDETIKRMVDISRVMDVHAYDQTNVLRGRDLDALWEQAYELQTGKGFIFTLAPFRDERAQENVIDRLLQHARDEVILPTSPTVLLQVPGTPEKPVALPVSTAEQSSLAIGLRHYRNTGRSRIVLQILTKENLATLISSGTIFRVDPIRPINFIVSSAGNYSVPPLPSNIAVQPIVGVVDGGMTAQHYKAAEAWCAPVLIDNKNSAHQHGNKVTALAVHGHAWNTNLPLPEVYCRVGTVQAIAHHNSNQNFDPQQFVDYLNWVLASYPNTRVWNMSFNENIPCDPDQVSYLGHEFACFARRCGVLLVISAGNKDGNNSLRIAPPADCEAALVVGGRKTGTDSHPGNPCDYSLPGPGPAGMLKPDLSHYSTLWGFGGSYSTGTSYATPLISSLAANTFANLKKPTPDSVRALLINQADLMKFEPVRGWGSPVGTQFPWMCAPGTVTLAWQSKLIPGYSYYWNNIPITQSLVTNEKLRGKGWLTAVLNPHPYISSESDSNYFSARINVALQYFGLAADGQEPPVCNLLGTLSTDILPEADAKADQHMWHPVRRHCRDFSTRGLGYSRDWMRLHARVYLRDEYQFGPGANGHVQPLEVAFVLTLSDGTDSSQLYNDMRTLLGNFVESAVIDQEVDVDVH